MFLFACWRKCFLKWNHTKHFHNVLTDLIWQIKQYFHINRTFNKSINRCIYMVLCCLEGHINICFLWAGFWHLWFRGCLKPCWYFCVLWKKKEWRCDIDLYIYNYVMKMFSPACLNQTFCFELLSSLTVSELPATNFFWGFYATEQRTVATYTAVGG